MDARIKALREERNTIWNGMKDVLAQAETREGGLSGELLDQYNKAEADLDAKAKEIEARERALDIEARMNTAVNPAHLLGGSTTATNSNVTPEARYSQAFYNYATNRDNDVTDEVRSILRSGVGRGYEVRDIGVGTGASGGFLVPQGFLTKLTTVLKFYGSMRDLSNVIVTASGNDMPWPRNDDTGNTGGILGENTSVAELDVTLTSKTLKAYMYHSGMVKASWQLLNDSAFDVEEFLTKQLGIRLGRIQNTHFTTGTGTGQPEGILQNAAANSPLNTAANSVNLSTSLSNTTAGAGYGFLVDVLHKLDPAYRLGGNVQWQMHDTVLASVRKLTDSNQRPIWEPAGNYGAIAPGQPDTLLGYPVRINSDMPASPFSASTVGIVAVGDWKQHYIIRDVLGTSLVRLDERFADQLQAGFFAFLRGSGAVDDPNAVAYGKSAAS